MEPASALLKLDTTFATAASSFYHVYLVCSLLPSCLLRQIQAPAGMILTACWCAFCAGLKAAKAAVWSSEKTIYDWCYSHETAGWVEWMATVPPYVPDPDASFSQIIVPTSDTVRYNYLLKILALAGKHVLFVGETGTGKGPFHCHTKQAAALCLPACAVCCRTSSRHSGVSESADLLTVSGMCS